MMLESTYSKEDSDHLHQLVSALPPSTLRTAGFSMLRSADAMTSREVALVMCGLLHHLLHDGAETPHTPSEAELVPRVLRYYPELGARSAHEQRALIEYSRNGFGRDNQMTFAALCKTFALYAMQLHSRLCTTPGRSSIAFLQRLRNSLQP